MELCNSGKCVNQEEKRDTPSQENNAYTPQSSQVSCEFKSFGVMQWKMSYFNII